MHGSARSRRLASQRLAGAPGAAAVRRRAALRLVLCDPQRLYAEPLAAALRAQGHDVFLATTPARARQLQDLHRPDLCLMEMPLPVEDGAGAIALVAGRQPRCPVVVLSGVTDPAAPAVAVKAGATAFLSKDASVDGILEAVCRVAAGEHVPASPELRPVAAAPPRVVGAHPLVEPLTPRERQVLDGLVRADNTMQMARSMGVAPSTVRTHLQGVFAKLGVTNRIQAVAVAVQQRLVEEL